MAGVNRFFSGDVVLFDVDGRGQVQGTVEMMTSPTEVIVNDGMRRRYHPDALRLVRFDQSRRTVTAIHLLHQFVADGDSSPEVLKHLHSQALDVLDPTGLIRKNLEEAARILKARNTASDSPSDD